ncbi:MAG: peptidoglycan-binding protein [Verrucomicrobiota bacterium]|nr:peptidoglycan-binding protein [Verrucomicrobiota bacterium]
MKHLASLAVLLTLAATQVALAEEQNPQQAAKKQPAKHVVTRGTTTFQKPQFTHKNTNVRVNTGVRNSNIQLQTTHHVNTVNPNWHNKIQNTSTAKTIQHTQNWKNNPNWQKNQNWKGNVNFKSKNWWANNPQWRANHAKWANYRRWDRERHDRSWWSGRYNRFALFGGGYYYWNNGFWYPAYGYDPEYSTYSYDAPIYSYNGQEPAQVVASVQSALQQAGYDPGPVDNTYGPQTRDALMRYQADNGLPQTGEIDEATLASFGMD